MARISLSKPMTSVVKVLVFVGILAGAHSAISAEPSGVLPPPNPLTSNNTGNYSQVDTQKYFEMQNCTQAKSKYDDAFSALQSNCLDVGTSGKASNTLLENCIKNANSCSSAGRTIDIEAGSGGSSCEDVLDGLGSCTARAGKAHDSLQRDYDDLKEERRELDDSIDTLEQQLMDDRMEMLDSQQTLQNDLNDRRKEQRGLVDKLTEDISKLDNTKQEQMRKFRQAMRQIDRAYNEIDKDLTEAQQKLRDRKTKIYTECESEAYKNRDAVKQAREQFLRQSGQAIARSTSAGAISGKKKRQKEFATIIKECLHRKRLEIRDIDQDAQKAIQISQKRMMDLEEDRALLKVEMQELLQQLEQMKATQQQNLVKQLQESEQDLTNAYQQGTAKMNMQQQNMSVAQNKLNTKTQERDMIKVREAGAKTLARCTNSLSSDADQKLTAARDASANLAKAASACETLNSCKSVGKTFDVSNCNKLIEQSKGNGINLLEPKKAR